MTSKKWGIIFFVDVFVIVVSMSSFASAYKEYRKSMLNDAVKNMNKENKNSMIFTWDETVNNGHAYRKEANEYIQGVTIEKDIKNSIKRLKEESVRYINTDYTIKIDNKGHRAIAYVDEATNSPIIAVNGFYIVKKIDPSTKKVRNAKYYADSTGSLLSGWIKVGEKRYYLLEDDASFGEVVTGDVISRDGDIFSFDDEGAFIGVKQA
ncbi:MAG: hypothetical protein MJ151_00685 [Lachnospiraceae bacterium]|nr:hypothetical protein [Lachnospiraceae bacterium]